MKGIDIIKDMGPCYGSISYMDSKDNFYQAWNDCERGDWMLWIAEKLKADFKLMVKANAMCALTVRHLMTDKRSINYCQIALLFADGKATLEELKEAASAAATAADMASEAYSAYTAVAAAEAAFEEFCMESDRKRNQKETSDICREILTEEVFKLWDKKLKP